MLSLEKFKLWIDDNGDVWAESDQEDWNNNNFIWDEASGQLVFIDTPQKNYIYGTDGNWHLMEVNNV